MFVRVSPWAGWKVLLLAWACVVFTGKCQAVDPRQNAPGTPQIFSEQGAVLWIKITLPDPAIASLKSAPRTNVVGMVQEGNTVLSNVLVHLKGSTGSFRPIDQKPSLTLHFRGGLFHGLRKVHLNNSVEDPTYLNEYLGSEVFRAAGLRAGRVAHAKVELNGRDLGLYTLKEGFSEGSLFSQSGAGELYEPDPGHDVNESLRMVFGAETMRSRLQALASAALERDLAKRWQGLERLLDTEQFAAYMALEVMLNHRDGYCMGRNNFRLYHDSKTDRFQFLPYGMDQLFGKVDASLLPRMSGIVASGFMETPEGRRLYKGKLYQVTTNAFRVSELNRLIDVRVKVLQPVLERPERQSLEKEAEQLKARIAARHENVLQQMGSWSREQVAFAQGRASLTNWVPTVLGNKGRLEMTKDEQGHAVLLIKAEAGTVAAWKSRVLLPRGHYVFSGLVKTLGVKTLRTAKSPGARLRLPGYNPDRTESLAGTGSWKQLEIRFNILESEQKVEVLCELSADEGEAAFRLDSLNLKQIP